MEPTFHQRVLDFCARHRIATDRFSWSCVAVIVVSMSLIVWLK